MCLLLLSVTGGYPIGAKSCNELYKNGNAGTEECKRASMFMVCAGPGFLVSFIGMFDRRGFHPIDIDTDLPAEDLEGSFVLQLIDVTALFADGG